MATSGSFDTTGYKGRYLTFSWEVKSQSVNDNTTTISWYLRGAGDTTTSYYYTQNIKVTIDGVTVFTHLMDVDGQILLRNGTVVASGTYTFKHGDDGNRNFSAYAEAGIYNWAVNCTGTSSFSLPQIARASIITSAADTILGGKCAVKWTPMSAAFYYKMGFQIGDWKYSTEVVHPNSTAEYTYRGTISLEAAAQIPKATYGTMYVYLHTFSDSAGTVQIGNTSSATFKVTVPDNANTKPKVSMTLSPVSSLPSKFASLYIQGVTKVKATLSAKGEYGATIEGYSMRVDGVSYGPREDYTSSYLTMPGSRKVYGYATDVRQFTGENPQEINVIAYSNPKLEGVSAVRCDDNGNESDSGTYLKITAKRSYSPVISNGVQKNFCTIRCQYTQNGTSWTPWVTILAPNSLSSDEVVTGPLFNGALSDTLSYVVRVMAIDDVGRYAEAYITVSTDKVYWHRDGERNALGLGKYNERDNAIDSAWDFYMNGNKVTGLPAPVDATDAVPLGFLQDHIVQQGTSDDWVYRKWNSGLVELWGYATATRENGYVLSKELSYPITLTAAMCGIGTLNSYGGNSWESLPWNLKLAYGPTACKIWIHDSSGSFTADSALTASIYILGRWK